MTPINPADGGIDAGAESVSNPPNHADKAYLPNTMNVENYTDNRRNARKTTSTPRVIAR